MRCLLYPLQDELRCPIATVLRARSRPCTTKDPPAEFHQSMLLKNPDPGKGTILLDQSLEHFNFLAVHVLLFTVLILSRPGKSPERGGKSMENYEPISPPLSYQGIDKQEAAGPPPQRREAENSEIRYSFCSTDGNFFSYFYSRKWPASSVKYNNHRN